MPLLSAFTPCGMLALSSKSSVAEAIYQSMRANVGTAFAESGIADARLYADAMAFARARLAATTAENQGDARRCTYLLPEREFACGVVPAPDATLQERQDALAAAERLPAGNARPDLEQALRDLLGEDFLAYHPTPANTTALFPSDVGTRGLWASPSIPRRAVLLGAPVAVLGANTVPYHPAPGRAASEGIVQAGDRLVIDGGHNMIGETVTVTAASTSSFTAVFTAPHEQGALAAQQPFPWWITTKLRSIVIVSLAAATNGATRGQIHRLMGRVAQAKSTWTLATPTSPGHTGPFRVGASPLGHTTIGDVAYP